MMNEMNSIYWALGVFTGLCLAALVWQCCDLRRIVKRRRAIKELVKQLREQMPTSKG